MITFNQGASYYANASLGDGQFVVTVAGRTKRGIPIFRAGDTIVADRVMSIDGREFAQLRGDDGQLYGVSSAARADIQSAAELLTLAPPPWLRLKRAARRFFCGGRKQ